jgi:hypothetical protein
MHAEGGLLYAGIRTRRSNPRRKLISRETGVELFPLLMLAIASVSTSALSELLHSNRLILSVAGVVALLAILED